MQSKGAIKLLAILFAVVCLYQLSFTLITHNVEKKAIEKTGGDAKLFQTYIDSIQTIDVNVFESTFGNVVPKFRFFISSQLPFKN